MRINNLKAKLVAIGAAGILSVSLLAGLPGVIHAQDNDNGNNFMSQGNYRDQDDYGVLGRTGYMMRDRDMYGNRYHNMYMNHMVLGGHHRMNLRYDRLNARVRIDNDYLMRNYDVNRYFRVRGLSAGDFGANNIVLRDRDDISNAIVLQNSITGPFSTNINRVNLDVDHDFFTRAMNALDVDQNVAINVNTGNNTVSMNTIAGDLTTGDVNISVSQF